MRHPVAALAASLLLFGALAGAARADAPRRPLVELTTLDILKRKGIISPAEYDSALRDLADSVGDQASQSLTLVLGRWATTLYGFTEADVIYDSTQSFNENAGNGQVARPGTYRGDHGRFMMGVRNSRIGFRLKAPEFHRIRASAVFEMDFLGNQPPGVSESAFFTSPAFRLRHGFLKVETPIVDVLVGQYWQLMGWQSYFHPNTVEIQGVPGQLYSRTVQVRVSKTIKTAPVSLDLAIAMMRPPQRDSSMPEGQGGIRIGFNKWTGLTTAGSTGTSIEPLSFGLTGDVRGFQLPELSATPKNSIGKTGWGVAVDGFIPIVPARPDHESNALTVTGEYAYGLGTADLYSGLSGGVPIAPALPNPTMASPAPTYPADVDPGLVAIAADGTAHLINWQSYIVGLQYALPGLNGRLWVSGNYSHTGSNNAALHGPGRSVRLSEDWADGNLFFDLTPAARLGLEYAWFQDHYADGATGTNHRAQLSAFYLF